MMSKLRVQAVVALILATILVTAGLTTTFAYVAQRQYAVNLSAPSSVKCDQKAFITAKVTKVKNGAPVANQAVGWSFVARQSSIDRLSRDMSRSPTARASPASSSRSGPRPASAS